jgi:hypothetical protein
MARYRPNEQTRREQAKASLEDQVCPDSRSGA